MKRISILGLFVAITSLGSVAAARAQGTFVTREYVKNTDQTDWMLESGWTWSDGTLTHWNGSVGAAQQVAMPALENGRTYRVNFTVSNSHSGAITVTLGGGESVTYKKDGSFSVTPSVTNPSALLTLTPSKDFDGSISKVSVVQLGKELVLSNNWSLGEGWSIEGDGFRHDGRSTPPLTQPVAVQADHMYRVYFSTAGLPHGNAFPGCSMVSLGGAKPGCFGQHGDWNYAFDMRATAHNLLMFMPQDPADAARIFGGVLRAVSVREITSDFSASTTAREAK